MKKTLRAQSDREPWHSPAAHQVIQHRSRVGFIDYRPEAIAQLKLADAIHHSPYMAAQRQQLGRMFGPAAQLKGPEDEELQMKAAPGVMQRQGGEEEELLQGKFQPVQRQGLEDEELLQGKFTPVQRVEDEELLQGKFTPVQREVGPEDDELLQGKFVGRAAPMQLQDHHPQQENRTGMPDQLKAGIESLSGMSLDNVRVHYNSSQPAQLNALAYAQDTDIHIAQGQEQHLPHEAWHIVQQAQGRVQPTMQMKDGVPVNDDASLEHEADVMGEKALQMPSFDPGATGSSLDSSHSNGKAVQQKTVPIQRYTREGEKTPNKYLKGEKEDKEEFRKRMEKEMIDLRKTMVEKDAKKDTTMGDYHGLTTDQKDWPENGKLKANPEKVKAVLNQIKNAQTSTKMPTVAISYRGGFGYDKGAFSKGNTKANVVSAPSGFKELPQGSEVPSSLFDARDPKKVGEHLKGVHGLYIPGGQDATDEEREKSTRETYEQALIAHARNTGLPTLGICGGSRCVARGFGGKEQQLSMNDQKVHNNKGTTIMSHGLKFPEPHTILGGAASKGGEVDKINSTHQKIVAYDKLEKTQKVPELIGVNKLLGTGESELRVSAVSPEGHPEGFETRYGAPILGVTSHPEAIHGANSKARENASEDGKTWSDNIFKGFEQSMKAYAGKQEVNAEIRGRGDLMKRYAEYYGGDGTDMPVSWEPYNEEDTVDYGYRDFLRNSPHSPFSK